MKAIAVAAVAVATGAAMAQGATYSIDAAHTSVVFEADAGGLSTLRGRLARVQGTISLDRAARTGRAEIGIDTTSASTGIAAIDGALQGKDLLDTATHPTARFLAERFVFDADQVAAVEGTLTLLGRDRPVALKAVRFNCYTNPLYRREVCGGDFETRVARADFGIGAGLPVLGESFRLLIQVEAIRQP